MRIVKANRGNQEAKSSQNHSESRKIISKQASESFRNHQNRVSGSPESSKSSISGLQRHQIVSYPGISSSQGSYTGIIQEKLQNRLKTIKILIKSLKSIQNQGNPRKSKEIGYLRGSYPGISSLSSHLSGHISISRPREALKTIKIQENHLFWPSFLTSALYFQSIIQILPGFSRSCSSIHRVIR